MNAHAGSWAKAATTVATTPGRSCGIASRTITCLEDAPAGVARFETAGRRARGDPRCAARREDVDVNDRTRTPREYPARDRVCPCRRAGRSMSRRRVGGHGHDARSMVGVMGELN